VRASTSISGAAEAPEPAALYSRPGERVWRLDAGGRAQLAALGELGDDVADPLPGLVTVGRTDPDNTAGGYLLLNLEALGVTSYAGPAADVTDLLTTAVLELATSPWGGWFDLRLVGVGFGDELRALDRISRADRIEDVLPDLSAQAAMVTSALADDRCPDAVNGRLRDADYDAYTLTVVVTSTTPDPDVITELTQVAGSHGGIAVLTRSPDAEGDLELTPGGRLRIAALGIEVTPQRLEAEEYRLIGDLFASTEAPPVTVPTVHPAGEDLLPILDDVLTTPDNQGVVGTVLVENVVSVDIGLPADVDGVPSPRGTPTDELVVTEVVAAGDPVADDEDVLRATPPVEVRVLGPFDITGAAHSMTSLCCPELDSTKPAHNAELVLLLALRGEAGVSGEGVRGCLAPTADHALKTDYARKIIIAARKRLGPAVDGAPRITYARRGGGRHHLHPEIGMDWTRFQALVASGGRDNLRAALALVRGKPFDGAYFWWLDELVIDRARADVVDAAEQLAELELAADHHGAAAEECRQGMLADPGNERLCRVMMRARHAAGDTAGTHRAFNALLEELRDLDPLADPHPQTLTTYRELTRTGTG